METAPVISIVVVNRNTCALLGDCLASVFDSGGPAVEVTVVDNDSSDGSREMVRNSFPEVGLIENRANRGFSAATNQGIEASRGRYVLLLNSDTVMKKGAVHGLWTFMEAHPDAGVCASRLVGPDGLTQPYLFGSDPTLPYLLHRALKRALVGRPLHDWNTRDVLEVDWVSGACMVVRKEALDVTGLFDENIFMYFEDTDLCLRMRKSGWRVYYCPFVSTLHLGGQSLSADRERRAQYFKSLSYFYRKHYSPAARLTLRLLLAPYRFYLRSFPCT